MAEEMATLPFGPLNSTGVSHLEVFKQILVKPERFLRLSRDLGRWSSIRELRRLVRIVNSAPTGINRWSSKREGLPPIIFILFKHTSDASLPF